jgi:sugar lactone lactonase YvrE
MQWQATELAERCSCHVRWRDLVHDPVYGIGGYYDGIKADPEQEKHNVYRVDPKSAEVKVVVDDFVEPNGIALSPDEKKIYVIDTGFTDGPDNRSHIRVFDLDIASEILSNSKVFAEMPKPSITDGLRTDSTGRVWCSVGWGIRTRTAFAAIRPKVICSARSTSRKPSSTSASAASTVQQAAHLNRVD